MSDHEDDRELELAEDSEGWDDVEDDTEDLNIKSLFSEATFKNLASFVANEREKHDFDLTAIKAKNNLDFYGLIKLVNYVRSEVAAGRATPDISNASAWADDKYLQPVLENDALLFSLDDLDSLESSDKNSKAVETTHQQSSAEPYGNASTVIADLEAKLANLQSQFEAYREQVSQTLDKRWHENEPQQTASSSKHVKTTDDHYFEGYSYNDIHQTMLQDTVRTDAYRDFIYDNKHLFKDKVVMDVGCGTGILSMFCAKAGAKKVVAVDNSAIIDKARQVAIDNGFSKTIVFVKSKVEEIHELPEGLPHVDIIVSEWMGYCLLFEAMLPSVLVARDRFLKRAADGKQFDGLIVPSHCNVQIAPLADPDWMGDNITFWKDVYGFDMHCMLDKALDDVVVRLPPGKTICGKSSSNADVRLWDLYETRVEDLIFDAPFNILPTEDIDSLDAWCIWFDIGFSPLLPAAQKQVVSVADVAKQNGAVTFSTGPESKLTHWQSGVCVIDWEEGDSPSYATGSAIDGNLRFSKGDGERALKIEIAWTDKKTKERKQAWSLR